MKLRMTKASNGSPNGHETKHYAAGTEHDLSSTPRERELAEVFLREGWAVEVGTSQVITTQVITTQVGTMVVRLPLIEEYVSAGYKAENYDAFLKRETEEAQRKGFVVEVRKLNIKELAEVKAEAEARAKLEAEAAAQREIEEKAAADAKALAEAEAQKAADAPAPTEMPTEAPPEESKKSGKRK